MKQELLTFPITKVREQFPALKRTYKEKTVTYLDGPGGTQVVASSVQAIKEYMEKGGANLHGSFPTSYETEEIIADARNIIADLFGVKAREVAFGANMTTLALSVGRALGKTINKGDEIVVTEIDHRANVDPWISMAEDRGATVRWLKVDPESLTLNLDNLHEVINEKTKLVAVGLASNAVGTINNVKRIAERAREAGALTAVDAVHAAPHIAIDRNKLGADILLCSAYKFFGPHVGIAVIKENVFEQLDPFKLQPAPDYLPDKLETGTQNHEGIAGIKPAVEFVEKLGEGADRRERILAGMAIIEEYENSLADKMREGLRTISNVKLYEAAPDVPKTPTIAFTVEGMNSRDVCKRIAEEHGIFTADGHFYATTLAGKLDINDKGGWVRAGLAPYNTAEEVEAFIQAVEGVIKG
ncbi:cysteine desulfurase-like protein [Evansella clarkii]|uniref:cysteine desulfurase-like protein n=1 Tax=Evansella clarkii TaxID=79879 RepID=UPI000B448CB3|nr:cysteine desulfurase-like protein [Evansella clarkii]